MSEGDDIVAMMTGGEAAQQALKALSVRAVFGVPSVHNLPIVDALGRTGNPKFWLARHEQGVMHMADAYARTTGELGVGLTSTGPGAGNAVTGLLEAFDANSPVLMITGQIPTRLLGRRRGSLHEAPDQPGMLRAVTKDLFRPESVAEIPSVIFEAAERARSGRPGPVAVEIPIDLQYEQRDVSVGIPPSVRPVPPRPAEVEKAVEEIAGSRRIAIWAGGGAVRAGAGPGLQALAERLGAPIITSISGRGVVDERHPLVTGAFGSPLMYPEASRYLEACDLWIAVGNRFRDEDTGDWALKAPSRLIHINLDRVEQNRNYPASVFLDADARLAVEALLQSLPEEARAWDEEVVRLCRDTRENAYGALGPWEPWARAIEREVLQNGVLTCDATIAAYAFADQVIRVGGPNRFVYPVTSAIGPGLPFGLGAQVGRPDAFVVSLSGDGGFLLDVGDLATAAHHNLPVAFVVFNDHSYNILKRIQQHDFARQHAVDLTDPDYVALGHAFGLKAVRVEAPEPFADALAAARADRVPTLIEIDMEPTGPIPLPGF